MSATADRPRAAGPPAAAPSGWRRRIGGLGRVFRYRGVLVVPLLVSAVLLGLVSWRNFEVRRDNEALIARRATERANAIAAQLRDTVAATLLQADAMHGLARLLTEARLSGNAEAERALRPYLDPATSLDGPDVAQVSAIGAAGTVLWSNRDWTPASPDLSDSEYFKALVANPALGAFIGRPAPGPTGGEWTVQYVRPLRDPAGALRAVTVVSLRVSMLVRLCFDLALAPADAVTLWRDDGVVMMRCDMTHLGETLQGMSGGAPEDTLLAARPSPVDGVPRYVASRGIPGTSLSLHVGLSQAAQAAALAELRETLWHGTLLLDGVIFAFATAGTFAVFLLRRSGVLATRAATLAESEAWFRGVIDDMADGVLVFDGLTDRDMRISYANRPAGDIFGLPAAQLLGREMAMLVDPADRTLVMQRNWAAMRGENLSPAMCRAVRPDGARLWLRTSSVVAANPAAPARLRMITTVRDLTEEHRHEAALAETRARIARMLDVIPGVFYQLSANPGEAVSPVFISPSVAMFGVSVEEASRPGFLTERSSVDLWAVRQAAMERAGPGGIATVEYPARLPAGEVWLRDTLRRIDRPDGGSDLVGFLADATAAHAAELARRAAEAELHRLNRALAAYSRSLFALIRSASLEELAMRVCEGIVEEPVYIMACVGLPESAPGRPVRLLAGAGSAIGYMAGLNLSWSADVPEGRGPAGIVLREGTPYVVHDSLTDPVYAPWRDKGTRFGFRSGLTVPCKVDDQILGVLMIYASEPDAFGPEERHLFERLGEEIGFAIRLAEDRARLLAAEAARLAAEENLRDAALLGPGVLYRARVHADCVEVLHVFGDADRVTRGFTCACGRGPTSLGTILLGSPDSRAAIRALDDNGTRSDEIPLDAGDGTTCWVRNAMRVTGHSGEAVEVVGYVSEVTQEKLQQLHRQQVATLLTLGEMATGMAHELNQPLASISFAAHNAMIMLGRQPADHDAVAGKLEKIIGEVRRVVRLIKHMRVFARNEREQVRPVSWTTVLESALEILGHRLHGCQVVSGVPEDLPAVMGAPIPMEQVLINLLANAIDAYDAAAAPVPRVVTVDGGVQNGTIVLRVADHAGGIPPQVLPRVFEPFFTTKPSGKGTGLGLALAFGTIIEMGGSITAANRDGGAVFEIRLPAARPAPADVGQRTASPPPPAA